MENIIVGKLRIQLISENIIRIEKSYKNSFEDRNTFFIPNRNNFNTINYQKEEDDNYVIISFNNYKLYIPKSNEYSKIKIINDKKETIYKFKKIKNSGELPNAFNTPKVFALNDAPHIIIPKSGYSLETVKNKDKYIVKENSFDMYLFIVNNDYKLLRKLFVELTGKPSLVRMQTMGLWNSKYYKYRQEEIYELIKKYDEYNLPLDNVVIDTDWRKANDIGIGYEIDTELFYDMKDVFDYAHSKNIAIMFNDHPEPYKKVCNVFDDKEIKFRSYNLTKLLELGLDTWWYDRNWTTKLISPTKRIEPETLGLYLFNDITKNHYKKYRKHYIRPDIMGNVNNINNGVYMMINDSASHRYPIQWTGDISCSYGDLTQEIKNLIKGSENEISFINFDVGGHVGNPTKEQYLNWMKFGAFTPIMRPHVTKYVERYREPWVYDEETLNICREYINMRYRLLGYLYSHAFENYQTGEPMFKSLGYEYPYNKNIKNVYDTYIIGQNIMVSPIGAFVNKKVSKRNYIGKVEAKYYSGTELKGKVLKKVYYDNIDLLWNHQKPFKRVPKYNFSASFKTKLKFTKDVDLFIRSDDGARVYINNELMLDDWNLHGLAESKVTRLKANKVYDIYIEYFQGGGEAGIQLFYSPIRDGKKDIIVPGDKWIDAFNGSIYDSIISCIDNDLTKFPIFIKEGSLIYLLKAKKNTKELSYKDLIIDYYPSKNIKDKGYIYEDDRETVAYQEGVYRKTNYETFYNENDNSIYIIIDKCEGNYIDDIESRNILFKYHLLNECDKVNKVYINNREVDYKINKKEESEYPFNEKENSPTSDILFFRFNLNIKEETVIKIEIE